MSRVKLKKNNKNHMKNKIPHVAILQNSSRPNDQLSDRYKDALSHFGATSEVIMLQDAFERIDQNFEKWDGVILTGADSNVCPKQYQNHLQDEDVCALLERGNFDRIRDQVSFKLIEKALDTDKPLLAICRGFQEMNVFFGGGLTFDIRSLHHNTRHDFGYINPDDREGHAHDVSIEKGGFFENFFKGQVSLSVNSIHRQGVQLHQKAPDLTLEALCDEGLFVEAVSYPDHPFLLGVQFHPEFKMDIPIYRTIFEHFLDKANEV